MPPVDSILLETLDPEGPYGAKECGQGPLLPVIPAVANAVHDALGVRIDETPVTPDKILLALEGRLSKPAVPSYEFPPDRGPSSMMRLPPFRYLNRSRRGEAARMLADHARDEAMAVSEGPTSTPT